MLRENPDAVAQNTNKNESANRLDAFIELDQRRRAIIQDVDVLKNKPECRLKRNRRDKRAKETRPPRSEEMRVVSDTIKGYDDQLRAIEEMDSHIMRIPNIARQKRTNQSAADNIRSAGR